jgi:hypothetical protein
LEEVKRQHELHEVTLARTLALVVEESKKLTEQLDALHRHTKLDKVT